MSCIIGLFSPYSTIKQNVCDYYIILFSYFFPQRFHCHIFEINKYMICVITILCNNILTTSIKNPRLLVNPNSDDV